MIKKWLQNQWAKVESEYWLSNLDKFLWFLFVLFLPTQLGKHFWPQFSYVLGQRIDYLSPTLYVTDIITGILFIIALIKKQITIYPLFTLVVLFISLSIFLSQNSMAGWYWLLKFFEVSFIVWYVVKKTEDRRLKTKGVLLGAVLSIGIVFESILAFLQFLQQASLGGLFYFFGERTFSSSTPGIANASVNGQLLLRPYATFSHPNVFAGFLLISLLLVIYVVVKKQHLRLKTTIAVGLIVLFATAGILLSLSRVVIILWLFCSLSLLVFYTKAFGKKLTLSIILVFLSLSLLLIVIFPQVVLRFAISPTDESLVVREALAKSALLMIASRPIFGVGPNNFIPSLPYFSANSFVLQPVHNAYLLIAAELGLPGILLYVSFLSLLVRQFFVNWGKNDRARKRFLLPLFLAFFSMLFIGFFDHYFLTSQQGILLSGLVIGCIWQEYSDKIRK